MKGRLASALLCATLSAALWPHAREAWAYLSFQDDPVALSRLRLNSVLQNHQAIVAQNIDSALANGDADLANSFVELAADRNIPLSGDVTRRVAGAVADEESPSHVAGRFASGLVTGSADDGASLSGTVTGDLLVFGDIRDILREGKHLAVGEETDRLVICLAAAGIAATAATYVSVAGAAPLRGGLSLVKDARKVGWLGEGLAQWAGRSAREAVDAPALEEAVASGSVMRPAETARRIRAAFRDGTAAALVRLAKDVGGVTKRAGTRGALDTLKIAEGPEDVARAARLAKAEGNRTRAILKLLGRGALLLASGAVELSLWLFSAVAALLGLLASIKAATERATQAFIDHGKRRALRRQTPAGSVAGAIAEQG